MQIGAFCMGDRRPEGNAAVASTVCQACEHEPKPRTAAEAGVASAGRSAPTTPPAPLSAPWSASSEASSTAREALRLHPALPFRPHSILPPDVRPIPRPTTAAWPCGRSAWHGMVSILAVIAAGCGSTSAGVRSDASATSSTHRPICLLLRLSQVGELCCR